MLGWKTLSPSQIEWNISRFFLPIRPFLEVLSLRDRMQRLLGTPYLCNAKLLIGSSNYIIIKLTLSSSPLSGKFRRYRIGIGRWRRSVDVERWSIIAKRFWTFTILVSCFRERLSSNVTENTLIRRLGTQNIWCSLVLPDDEMIRSLRLADCDDTIIWKISSLIFSLQPFLNKNTQESRLKRWRRCKTFQPIGWTSSPHKTKSEEQESSAVEICKWKFYCLVSNVCVLNKLRCLLCMTW